MERAASLNLLGASATAAATTASERIGSGSGSLVIVEAIVRESAEGFSTPLVAAPRSLRLLLPPAGVASSTGVSDEPVIDIGVPFPSLFFNTLDLGGLGGLVVIECVPFVNNLDTLAVAVLTLGSLNPLIPRSFFLPPGMNCGALSLLADRVDVEAGGCSSRILRRAEMVSFAVQPSESDDGVGEGEDSSWIGGGMVKGLDPAGSANVLIVLLLLGDDESEVCQ